MIRLICYRLKMGQLVINQTKMILFCWIKIQITMKRVYFLIQTVTKRIPTIQKEIMDSIYGSISFNLINFNKTLQISHFLKINPKQKIKQVKKSIKALTKAP